MVYLPLFTVENDILILLLVKVVILNWKNNGSAKMVAAK